MELHEAGRGPGDVGTFFLVEIPTYGEPETYIQNTSFQWFRDRELERAFPNTPGEITKGMNWAEYSRTIKYCGEHHWQRPNQTFEAYLEHWDVDPSTITVCKGIWDFYEKIGYDKKKKRYIR